jgi:hypothetical protein
MSWADQGRRGKITQKLKKSALNPTRTVGFQAGTKPQYQAEAAHSRETIGINREEKQEDRYKATVQSLSLAWQEQAAM